MTIPLLHYFQFLLLLNVSIADQSFAVQQVQYVPDSAAILYIITGSDWCPECRQLEKVLADSTFGNALARHGVEMMIVDFPQRKKLDKKIVARNQLIAEQFGFEGVFPTFILSNKERNTQLLYHKESAAELSQSILHEFDKLRE